MSWRAVESMISDRTSKKSLVAMYRTSTTTTLTKKNFSVAILLFGQIYNSVAENFIFDDRPRHFTTQAPAHGVWKWCCAWSLLQGDG